MEKVESNRIINTNWGLPLPPDILQVIFSKLPIYNLPACRLVCKTWNHLVLDVASSSKYFPNALMVSTSEIDPNYIPFESSRFCNPKIHCIDIDRLSSVASFGFGYDCWAYVSILNYCNGLLYISKEATDELWCDGILNPMTNEFFQVPEPQEDIYRFGFGFSPKSKRYKLFRVTPHPTESGSIMEIFRFGRSGTNQWSHFNFLPFDIYYLGAYLNGVIYWIGKGKENEFVVYALDVETEKIESVAILEVPHSEKAFIETFNGRVVYATIFMYTPSCKLEVWRMQEKNSWIREFVIDDIPNHWGNESFHLIKAFEDAETLFLVRGDLFCLDKTGRKIKIKKLDSNKTLVAGLGRMESLNFGSLANILAGGD